MIKAIGGTFGDTTRHKNKSLQTKDDRSDDMCQKKDIPVFPKAPATPALSQTAPPILSKSDSELFTSMLDGGFHGNARLPFPQNSLGRNPSMLHHGFPGISRKTTPRPNFDPSDFIRQDMFQQKIRPGMGQQATQPIGNVPGHNSFNCMPWSNSFLTDLEQDQSEQVSNPFVFFSPNGRPVQLGFKPKPDRKYNLLRTADFQIDGTFAAALQRCQAPRFQEASIHAGDEAFRFTDQGIAYYKDAPMIEGQSVFSKGRKIDFSNRGLFISSDVNRIGMDATLDGIRMSMFGQFPMMGGVLAQILAQDNFLFSSEEDDDEDSYELF